MKRSCFFIVIWIGCFIQTTVLAQESLIVSEYEVKAAFLYNFAKFVEWPAGVMGDSTVPFMIGILGNNSFGSVLDHVVGSKTVKGRRIVIRQFNGLQDLKFCHLLFISNSERNQLFHVMERIGEASTLTVGEMDGFIDKDGMIQFMMKGNRIHFSINLDAAEKARLKLSSKLLNLALTIVKKNPKGS